MVFEKMRPFSIGICNLRNMIASGYGIFWYFCETDYRHFMKKIYRVASLFSGCGGLDLGFLGDFTFMGKHYDRLPTKIVFANDFDSDASTCYNANQLLSKGDSCDCLLKDIRQVEDDKIPDFDILLAGFPCQPFSNAGNRKGVYDDNGRGTLFEECERILKAKINNGHKPLAFVFENVRGILSSKMESGITVPDEIKNRMEIHGYNVTMKLICASDYGVPQKRYRVLIIGTDKDKYPIFDFARMENEVIENNLPSEKYTYSEPLLLGNILKETRKDDPDNIFWEYSVSTQKMIDMIGPCKAGYESFHLFSESVAKDSLPEYVSEGKSWKDIEPDNLPPRFKKIHDDPKKYHAPKFYRRFALGEINGTITASAQPENCGITHPFENRRYTVREIARIQSFPDDFHFNSIPLQSRYKVIGNAVPPVLAWVVAKSLTDLLKQ